MSETANSVQEDFRTIRSRIRDSVCYEDYLKIFRPQYLRSFGSRTCNGIEVADLDTLVIIPHSTQQPVDGVNYFLFGYPFSQSAWFRLLGYTEEEQLLHLLQWGRLP